MIERRVESRGVTLRVCEHGPSDRPTVVLAHGYPDSSAVWDGVVPLLADRFHVVTYDTRGAGGSSAPADQHGYALEALAADLISVIDATCPGAAAHVVGHDWGAIGAWEAVTDPARSRRIASFTAIAGPCLDHVGKWLEACRAAGPRAFGEVLSQVTRSWYVGLFQLPRLPEAAWKRGLARRIMRRVAADAGTARTSDGIAGVALYRENVGPRLRAPRDRHTDLPVQVVESTRDRFVAPALYDDLARWAPNHYRRRIESGHWAPRSHPAAVAVAIGELIDHALGGAESRTLAQARPRKRTGPFDGKLVVVTGAGSGIGRATALAFADEGADLVCADVDQAAVTRTARLCELIGVRAASYVVDVSEAAAMERFAADVRAGQGVPDIVVSNAGIGLEGAFLDTAVADWDRILGVNLYGVIHGARCFGKQMVERGQGGHLVNVASGLAYIPTRRLPAYCTTKAAVLMLSECLGAELAPHQIGVSAICPGVVDTAITRSTRYLGGSEASAEKRRRGAARMYRKRAFPPERVANDIVRAVRERTPVVPVTAEAKLGWVLHRLSPALTRRLARVDPLGGT